MNNFIDNNVGRILIGFGLLFLVLLWCKGIR